MATAPDSLVGIHLEWTGVHHSEGGDFEDLSTHCVHYGPDDRCTVTAGGEVVGRATYTYKKLDARMAIVIYHPEEYQGRSGVVLNAMLDFEESTDRAVIVADGVPFAVADGKIQQVDG